MARPRRTTEQEWLDIFCDWDLAEQERTIAFLQELHRQAKRQASKRWRGPALDPSVNTGEDAGKPAGNGKAAGALFDELRGEDGGPT